MCELIDFVLSVLLFSANTCTPVLFRAGPLRCPHLCSHVPGWFSLSSSSSSCSSSQLLSCFALSNGSAFVQTLLRERVVESVKAAKCYGGSNWMLEVCSRRLILFVVCAGVCLGLLIDVCLV